MLPHIYFWPYQVKKFIWNNYRVKKIFEDTQIDKDALWKKYEKEVETEISSIPSGPDTDPSDFADFFESRLSDAADILNHAVSMHKYNFLALLCQTWENELISFVTKELKNYFTFEKSLSYSDVMKVLKANIDESKIEGLSKIEELRLLVNVLKHGEGRSAEELRKIRPDFFKFESYLPNDEGNDRLTIWDSIYLDSEALNIGTEEFYMYSEAINEFWKSMPIRVFLDDETPAVYVENGISNQL